MMSCHYFGAPFVAMHREMQGKSQKQPHLHDREWVLMAKSRKKIWPFYIQIIIKFTKTWKSQ